MDNLAPRNGWLPVISCMKGSKGHNDISPNQDNFSITYERTGWQIACVLDGHGKDGHFVSTRAVQTIPYYLLKSESWPGDVRAALLEAFNHAEKDLQMEALVNG